MNRMTTRRLLALIAALLVAGSAGAYDLSEMYPDTRFMDSASKAVQRSDMEGAFIQYERAAKYGNKEAQKLIGLSYLDGAGVDQDMAQAAAWLRLAGTFGDARTQSAYNDLMTKISDNDKAKADKIYAKLEKQYGDEKALKKRKKWVRKEIRSMSGSGAGRAPRNMRVQVALGDGRYQTVTMGELQDTLDAYVDEFERRLES